VIDALRVVVIDCALAIAAALALVVVLRFGRAVLDALPMIALTLFIRRRSFVAAAHENWKSGLLGGALSLGAYWIVIWAMTVAPIPIVAALRETSILIALLIGTFWLGEKVTPVRVASILLVVAGLALMRL